MKLAAIVMTILIPFQVFSAEKSSSLVESFFGTEESTVESDTPVDHAEIATGHVMQTRAWRAPNFSGQASALGWSEDVFAIPTGMERQVQFWVDIYTKYSTTQGVIHDLENIDLIYEVVDFKSLEQDKTITSRQKEKLKKKLVEDAKDRALALIEKLETLKEDKDLNENEKKVFKYFANLKDENKFKDAKDKNRIRFQLGQADRMEKAIFVSGRYLEDFERIFVENKIPKELTRLVFVESSFNVLARSKVGASGLWQIMPYTARPYKYLSATIDRRNYPLDATKLAVKLLKDNYNMLQSWPLAVTGYNHGPAGVRRITESYKTRNLAELVQNVRSKRSFGFASRNFYASFLAALEVERNANKYFKDVKWSKALDAKEVKLPVAVKYKDILNWFGGDDELAQVYNPHITHQARELGRQIPLGALISVPSIKYDEVLISMAKGKMSSQEKLAGVEQRELSFSKPTESKSAPSSAVSANSSSKVSKYKVSHGDTLIRIAEDFGVKVQDIMRMNELESARKIYKGQILRIPERD